MRFLNKDTATLDHVIPLQKGGSNLKDNLVIACGKCNETRGNLAKRPEEILT